MNLNSRLFDKIRIGATEEAAPEPDAAGCQHPGCKRVGEFRAPKGRGQEGRFFLFCLEHVKAYNASYNYFNGMPDGDVAAFQKEAIIGHRPTWKLGVNSKSARAAERGRKRDPSAPPDTHDPFDLFTAATGKRRQAKPADPGVSALTLKALETLGLEPGADVPTIKARYKELVKRLHPDANGGDRSREDSLREILKAYAHLKGTGMMRA
ncbi:MAG: J domain-containing protein [Bosea sp. (in: a-proteobacteria)]